MGLRSLKQVKNDVERMEGWLTSEHGYRRVLDDKIKPSSTAATIQRELTRWFSGGDRREDDVVVVYIAAHAGPAGKMKRHYVFTRDSTPANPFNTALETAQLPRMVLDGEGIRPQNILFILDTCYSAKGTGEALGVLAEFKRDVQDGSGSGLWVLAASGPVSQAADGAFVTGLLAVIGDSEVSPEGGSEHIDLATLLTKINEWFRAKRLPQQAEGDALGFGRRPQRFLRNKTFTRLKDGVPLSDEMHWNPKARGVEEFSTSGWFFTGRKRALEDLTTWITAPVAASTSLVVIGRPGSGKSAVLGWLVMTAHEPTRKEMESQGVLVDSATSLQPGAIDAAVHARGLTTQQVIGQIARNLRARESLPDLLRHMEARQKDTVILLDALDEAQDPLSLERDILVPLAACRRVRLVVGTRKRGDRVPLTTRQSTRVIDLDDDTYFRQSDIADFVFARLVLSDSPDAYGRLGLQRDARKLANRVAELAGRSFLFARVISRQLLLGDPVDTSVEGWEVRLPSGLELGDVFDTDLERFGNRRGWVEDLLLPLAYSRGKGIPQKDLWSKLASSIAGASYTNADIRSLKAEAGYYIVQDTDSGEIVFRLFHEEFADYLRRATAHEDIDRKIAEALWSLDDPPDGNGGWLKRSEPYVRNHLPAHAAKGNLLSKLIVDPQFLLRMSPTGLLRQLHTVQGGEAEKAAKSFRMAFPWLRAGGESQTPYHISRALLLCGAKDTFQRVQAGSDQAIVPLWAHWWPRTSSYSIADRPASIYHVSVAEWEPGHPVALVGRTGTIEVWDIDSGELLVEWETTIGKPVWGVELLRTEAGPMLLARFVGGTVGLFDLSIRKGIFAGRDLEASVTAMRTITLSDRVICVLARENLSMEVRSVPELKLELERPNATKANVYSLQTVGKQGEVVLVSAGDSVNKGELAEMSMLRTWSLPNLEPTWEDHLGRIGCLKHIQPVQCFGRELILTSQDHWGPAELWDLNKGELLYVDFDVSERAWLFEHENRTLLLTVRYGRLNVQELLSGESEDETITSGGVFRSIPVQGESFSPMFELSGRRHVLSHRGDAIMVWDLEELLRPQPEEVFSATPPIAKLIPGRSACELIAATADRRCTGIDGATGSVIWERSFPTNVGALATWKSGGRSWVIAGMDDGTLYRFDSEDEIADLTCKAGDEVEALSVVKWRQFNLLFVNVRSGQTWATRVWNPDSMAEVAIPKRGFATIWPFQLSHGEEDKRLYGLTAMALASGTRLAFASKYGRVMVSTVADEPQARIPYADFDEWHYPWRFEGYTTSLSSAESGDRRLLAAGNEDGGLAIWDFDSGESLSGREEACRGDVRSLHFRRFGNDVYLVSAGDDGRVRFWTLALEERLRIDIAERITSVAFPATDLLAIGTQRGILTMRLNEARVAAKLGRNEAKF